MKLIINHQFTDVIAKMKKSELKHIIRESIKKLMREERERIPCDDQCADHNDCPPAHPCAYNIPGKPRGCKYCIRGIATPYKTGKTPTTNKKLMTEKPSCKEQAQAGFADCDTNHPAGTTAFDNCVQGVFSDYAACKKASGGIISFDDDLFLSPTDMEPEGDFMSTGVGKPKGTFDPHDPDGQHRSIYENKGITINIPLCCLYSKSCCKKSGGIDWPWNPQETEDLIRMKQGPW